MCAKRYTAAFCSRFMGCGARRLGYRIRRLLVAASQRRKKAGRAAPLKKAPIYGGIIRYYRRNRYGNIQLPPIRIENGKCVKRKYGRYRFRKVFLGARPSERFTGDVNFQDLHIYRKSVSMVRRIARDMLKKKSILDKIHKDVKKSLERFIDNDVKMEILYYIKAFYCFLMHTDTGIYARKFEGRNYGFLDMNNLNDTWLRGWEFELLDEIWTAVWSRIPGFNSVDYIIQNHISTPGRIPIRRLWRNQNGMISDECVKQVIRYLIEETYEPCFWNMICALIL